MLQYRPDDFLNILHAHIQAHELHTALPDSVKV